MENGINIDKIVQDISPNGLDEATRKESERRALSDYNLTVGPVMLELFKSEAKENDLFTEDYIRSLDNKVQHILLNHKIKTLVNSKNKKESAKSNGGIFPSILDR